MLVALRPPVRFAFAKSNKEFGFLERRFTPRTVFMEIGGSDCTLAQHAATFVERVYAIDVSGQFIHSVLAPSNLRLVLCDGVRIPVPAATVDLAWSGAFMDHLHPDDATGHLRSVRSALSDGGEYLCETTSPQETRRRMLAAGFAAVRMPLFSRFFKSVRIAAIK